MFNGMEYEFESIRITIEMNDKEASGIFRQSYRYVNTINSCSFLGMDRTKLILATLEGYGVFKFKFWKFKYKLKYWRVTYEFHNTKNYGTAYPKQDFNRLFTEYFRNNKKREISIT